jgi:virulence-associated protein VapD
MSPLLYDEPEVDSRENEIVGLPTGSIRMYAIAFDLDTAQLEKVYPNASYKNAYGDIRKVLEPLGFQWQQGSVYFGGPEMNAVKCVLAAQQVSIAYPWFKGCVRDIRMLRIEEFNDLAPAL